MDNKLFDIEKTKKNKKIRKTIDESSILGNTLFAGTITFPIILIIMVIIFFEIYNLDPYLIGISSFLMSIIISIIYYLCQKRKKCKIHSIFNK